MGHQNAALLSKLACLSAERRLDIHLRLSLSLHPSSCLAAAAVHSGGSQQRKIRDGVKPELAGIPIQQNGLGVRPPKKDLFLESLIKLKYHRREMLPAWKNPKRKRCNERSDADFWKGETLAEAEGEQ